MSNIRKYIPCDNCGKKIYKGNIMYKFEGFCGIYCSAICCLESAPIETKKTKLTNKEVDVTMHTWKEESNEQT